MATSSSPATPTMGEPARAAWGQHRTDLLIAAVLALVAAIVSHRLSGDIPLSAYQPGLDMWFEGDLGRVVLAMADGQGRAATHRSAVHPLFILLTNPPVTLLRWMGLGQLDAARAAIAAITGAWLAVLYGLLRLVGLRRLDASVFALVGGTSAAAAIWLTVPETYGLGSLTMMVALGIVALKRYRPVPEWAAVAASAGSLSITTTNWMAGLAATVVSYPLRRAAIVTVKALAVVVVAWSVQNLLFPDVEFFIGNVEQGSQQFLSGRAGGPLQVLKVSFLYSEVIPFLDTVHKGTQFSVQKTPPSYGGLGTVAAAGWAMLLALGAWALAAAPVSRPFRLALALTLAGQAALVVVYGSETFLYTLNFTCLLVPVAALAATTRLRPLVLVIASVVAVCGAINNYGLRVQAAERVHELLPQSDADPFSH